VVLASPNNEWSTLRYLLLAAAAAAYLCLLARGRLRDATLMATSLLLGLAALETFSVIRRPPPLDYHQAGYSVTKPILGWGPEHPGVFKHLKRDGATHAAIYDVDYTVDSHLLRAVESASTGPAVAFFGDSMTFGTGLRDSQTLPQQFADLFDRKIGVFNFGFPGYGPQQFLRALETRMFDPLLRGRTRLFVFETAAWHAERSSCRAGFMLRAPRYVMENEKPVFQGACYQDWTTLPMQLFANTSLYHSYVEPAVGPPTRSDIDLYVAILARAGQLARQMYGAPTVILFVGDDPAYLHRAGVTDEQIMAAMRDAGLDVIDALLDPAGFPGKVLAIPGDGHPTEVANAARAAMLKAYFDRKGLADAPGTMTRASPSSKAP
jgi:hypothetical protein